MQYHLKRGIKMKIFLEKIKKPYSLIQLFLKNTNAQFECK